MGLTEGWVRLCLFEERFVNVLDAIWKSRRGEEVVWGREDAASNSMRGMQV